jgi:hypothetical protein
MPNLRNIHGTLLTAEGLALGNCREPIKFPSGLIQGNYLDAFFTSANAQFGFNKNAHRFSTTWVPQGSKESIHGASGQLPPAGAIMGFTIENFLISGIITHSEYKTGASQGTIVNIEVEDLRSCNLDKVKIHTEDLNSTSSGVVSVARGYRLTKGLFNNNNQVDDALYFEYRNILENGCTYPQVLSAIQKEIDDGRLVFDISTIPTAADFEANVGGDVEALRFQFNMTPLSDVITRICQDTAYDWYWSMAGSSAKLINRKVEFDLQESQLFDLISTLGAASGISNTISLGFGKDLVSEPRRVRLLGARKEGFINSKLLSPLDGIDVPASGITFYPAWPNLTVSFFDPNGFLRSYKPTDKELQMALNGIETWTYFKKFQTKTFAQGGFGLPGDAGSIAALHPDFQSRLDPGQPIAELAGNASGNLRLATNRRSAVNNWVINFFNRVQDHAQRHFGKSYVASGVLVTDASGAFRLTATAWANVENQIEGQPLSEFGSSGLFIQDYEINRRLGPVSPFKTVDDKIAAHCVFPSGTLYGPRGEDTPAGFGEWTEDAPPFNPSGDGAHYIPVRLSEVGEQVINPRDNVDLYSFEDYPDGTIWCQLPAICASGKSTDQTLTNLVTLVQNALDASNSGLVDTFNLAIVVEPYQSLTGVAIPIIETNRYGAGYPDIWVSGQLSSACDNEVVVVNDQFGPWNFPPQGTLNSLSLMSDRAFRFLQGSFINTATSQYASVEQVGFPTLSFDSFANQSPDSQGRIGVRTHGVTDLNFAFSSDGAKTVYKIASFFSEFGREAPLSPRLRNILNGILNPIDYTDFNLRNNLTGDRNPPITNPVPPPGPGLGERGERTERVTITTVNNALTFLNTPSPGTQERYRGITAQQYELPPCISCPNLAFSEGARCLDGFLYIGDEAL